MYLNNYFDFHVRLSIRVCVCLFIRSFVCSFVCPKKPFSEVVSQNVTYKICLLCVKHEKYAPSDPSWTAAERGEDELRIIKFKTTWS